MTKSFINLYFVMSFALCSTSLFAQTVKAASKPVTILQPNFVAGDKIAMTPCSEVVPNGLEGPPVTMRIGSMLLQLKDNGRIAKDIKRRLADGTLQDVEGPTNATKLWPTNLDMQLAEPIDPARPQDGYKPNDYVIVTIVLRMVRGIRFLQVVPLNGNDSSVAVMAEPGKGNRFCGRTEFVETGSGINRFQQVSFGVLKGSDVRSINIGLMIPSTNSSTPEFWLPIIIDPIVENEG